MPADSLIRLKQLNQPELSGYAVQIILQYLSSGGATNTGVLTGAFYPRYSNPAGYVQTGDVSGLATKQDVTGNNLNLLAQVDSTYYPRSNPTGFITLLTASGRFISAIGDNINTQLRIKDTPNNFYPIDYVVANHFYLNGPNSRISLWSPSPFVSGFNIISPSVTATLINGQTPVTPSVLSTGYVPWTAFQKSGVAGFTGFSYLSTFQTNSGQFLFDAAANFYLKGARTGFPSEQYVIDLYGKLTSGPAATGKPYIYGFDIYAGKLQKSGYDVLTTQDIAGLTGTPVNTTYLVNTTGSQIISGSKRFASTVIMPFLLGDFHIGTGFNNDFVYTLNSGYFSNGGGAILFSMGQNANKYFLATGSGPLNNKITVDWGNRRLFDTGVINGTTITGLLPSGMSLDWGNSILYSPDIQPFSLTLNQPLPVVNWKTQKMFDGTPTNTESVDWKNRQLKEGLGGIPTVDWQNARLYSPAPSTGLVMDWNSLVRTMYGTWTVQDLIISNTSTFNVLRANIYSGDFLVRDSAGRTRVKFFQTGSKETNIYDASGQLRFEAHVTGSRQTNLYDSNGLLRISVDPLNFSLIDSNTVPLMYNRILRDGGGSDSIDWHNKTLSHVGVNKLDWQNSQLLGPAGASVDWQNYFLTGGASRFDSTYNIGWINGIDWNEGTIRGGWTFNDPSGNIALSSFFRVLTDEFGIATVDWGRDLLGYGAANLRDHSQVPALFWPRRQGVTSDGSTVSFDWQNRILSGAWSVLGSFSVNGVSITGNGSGGSGSFVPDGTFVRTTGAQTITGVKTFNNNILTSGIGANSQVDLTNLALRTAAGVATVNWNTRTLSGDWNVAGNLSGSGQLITPALYVRTTGNQTISGIKTFATGINTPFLSYGGIERYNLINGFIKDASENTIIDTFGYILNDPDVQTSINWDLRRLFDSVGASVTLDWNARILSGDWSSVGNLRVSGEQLNPINYVRTTGNQVVAGTKTFSSNILVGALGSNSEVDVSNYILRDSTPVATVDWNNANLRQANGGNAITLNWHSRILSGSWNINGALSFSGVPFNTATYVQTTGNQAIGGQKIFLSPIVVGAIGLDNQVDIDNYQLKNSTPEITLDWEDRILSGIWNVKGALLISGQPISTGASSSTPVTGSGNYLARFNSNNTGIVSTNLYAVNNNFGINTTSPVGVLTLRGATGSEGNLGILINNTDGANMFFGKMTGLSNRTVIDNYASQPIEFRVGSSTQMTITNGQIAIGNSSLGGQYRMGIFGTGLNTSVLTLTNTGVAIGSYVAMTFGQQTDSFRYAELRGWAEAASTNGGFGICTATNGTMSEKVRVSAAGRVGIGTTNPGYTLEVSGSGNFVSGLFVSGVPVVTTSGAQTISGVKTFANNINVQTIGVTAISDVYIDVINRQLLNEQPAATVDWGNCTLYDQANNLTVDWGENKTLTGAWKAQTLTLGNDYRIPFVFSIYNVSGTITGLYSGITVPSQKAYILNNLNVEMVQSSGVNTSSGMCFNVLGNGGQVLMNSSKLPVFSSGLYSGKVCKFEPDLFADRLPALSSLRFSVTTGASGIPNCKQMVNLHFEGYYTTT